MTIEFKFEIGDQVRMIGMKDEFQIHVQCFFNTRSGTAIKYFCLRGYPDQEYQFAEADLEKVEDAKELP